MINYKQAKQKAVKLKHNYFTEPSLKTYREIIKLNKSLRFKDMVLINMR